MSPDVHPSSETLAAHTAGDLGPADAAVVSGHLESCATCRDDAAAIAGATRALRALPVAAMPDHVAAAVDAALRAEAGGPAAPVPITSARRRRFMPIAAAAATVGLVAALGYGATRGGSAGDDTGATTLADGGGTAAAAPLVLQTGTDYTEAALDDQVRGVLAAGAQEADAVAGAAQDDGGVEAGAAQEDSGAATTADAPAGRSVVEMRAAVRPDDAALRSCVTELAGAPDVVPILVDVAAYAGRPAWVVVLPFRDDRVDVFVVGPACREGDAHLLYFERVSRR